MHNYGMEEHFLLVMAPVSFTTAASVTGYVDLSGVESCTFLLNVGTCASSSSTNTIVTIEASSAAASNATEGQVLCNYRKSAALATDTMTAVTAMTTAAAGVPLVPTTDANKIVLIDIDPAVVLGSNTNKNGRYVRAVITPNAQTTATIVGITAIMRPMYAGATMVSSITAS
jgi:hypothetical protein